VKRRPAPKNAKPAKPAGEVEAVLVRSFKYKLKPTAAQIRKLETTLVLCQQLYNAALEERIGAYRKAGISLSVYDQQKHLPAIRKTMPEYAGVHSQVQQDVIDRLGKAYDAFFRRVKAGEKPGFPRFQGRNRYNSFKYPQYKQRPGVKHVYLSKIGNVRYHNSRPVNGEIKTCVVKRDAVGDWWVIFTAEVKPQLLPPTGKSVGVDAGLNFILASSDNQVVPAPEYFRKAQKDLRKAQRKLSRRKKGSNGWKKARTAVAKKHRKVARQRADFNHKLARSLVNYYDHIAHENLSIEALSRSMLAKSFGDAALGMLFRLISDKAECAGRTITIVPAPYTSQTCPACQTVKPKARGERTHDCPCGLNGDRDVVAAMVILGWASPEWHNVSATRLSVPLESPAFTRGE
jgi:putative transposase